MLYTPCLVPLNSGTNNQPVTTQVSSMLSSTLAPWSSWVWVWLEWNTLLSPCLQLTLDP